MPFLSFAFEKALLPVAEYDRYTGADQKHKWKRQQKPY